MSKKKKIIISAILAIALIIFFGLKEYNKPHVDVVKATPDIIASSEEIINEFQDNEGLANKKYLDQIVQISGRISKIEASENNDIILSLLNDKMTFGTVICHLTSDENKKLINLKVGQNIVVKGICTGYLMDVILIRCNLVKI